jgi:hypothetical protein
MDADGSTRAAYRLTENTGLPALPQLIYYLDGAFRIIRVDTPCGDLSRDCEHYRLYSWQQRGAIAPYGIGLPIAISEANELLDYSRPNETPLEVEVSRGKDHVRIRIQGLTYDFKSGQMVPSTDAQEVVKYEAGEGLPAIDALDMQRVPLRIQPRVGPLYPGSNEDILDVGHTPDQFLEGLIANSSRAASMLRSGCVLSILLYSEATTGTLLEPARAQALIQLADDKARTQSYRIDASLDLFGNSKYRVTEESAGTASVTCAQANQSPWPVMTGKEAFNRILNLGIGEKVLAMDFARTYAVSLRPPQAGWDSYAVSFQPSFVDASQATASFDAYYVQLEANTGLLEGILAAPNALQG